MPVRLLIGDIGGTNARLELWAAPAHAEGAPPFAAFEFEHAKVR